MQAADPVQTLLDRAVASGDFAGAATLARREGGVAQAAAAGWRDMAAGLSVQRDTLFRTASVTKPMTSVVALALMEEGRFALDEPITRWAPEFADMRVLRDPAGPLDAVDPAVRPITFEDLLTHRSGLTYGGFQTGALAEAFKRLGGDIDSALSPNAWIAALSTLPLVDQPGAGFHYGHSTDLLGLLLARMENAPLGEVMARRLFEPLGMVDTGFSVPAAKRDRRAKMYGFDEQGGLIERPTGSGGAFLAERPDGMTFQSGGQGLWSTVDDVAAFARLFLNGGAVDGVRILTPETTALMTANRLSDAQRAAARMLGMPVFAGHGFGLGVAVVMDPDKAPAFRCKGGVGTVGWPGAFGGWWQADPIDRSVMVFLAHNALDLAQMANGIGLGVYAAIGGFHAARYAGG